MNAMEEQIKNKLKGHRVAWDKEALWEELETQLPQRPKRRWWLWGLWLLPLLIALPFCGEYDHLTTLMKKQEIGENSPTQADEQAAEAEALPDEPIRLAEINPTTVQSPERTARSSDSRAFPSRKANTLNSQVNLSPAFAETPAGPVNSIEFSRTGANTLAKTAPRTNAAVTAIETLPFELLPTALNEELPPTIVRSEITPVATRPRFFATADLGLLNADKTFELPANDAELATRLADHQSHLQTRRATTQTFALGCRISNRLWATVGLGRQQIHERFNYDEIVRSDTLTGYVEQAAFFVQSSGDTLFFGGQGDYVEQDRLTINQTNRLSSTFLPLELHYAQRYRSLAFHLGAGAHWTATTKYHGRLLNADGEVVLDPYFPLQQRWGYALHLGVSFLSTRNRTFYARYAYRRSPSWDYAGVRQTFATYGLRVGVRVAFE